MIHDLKHSFVLNYLRITFRLLALATLSPAFVCPAFSADVGTGLVAINEGDDRMRPAAALNICTTGGWQARGYLYGRNYGPVHERDYIFSFSKLFDVSGKFLQGSTGLSLSAEDTTIKFSDNPEDNAHYTGTNIGIDFGLNATFFTLGSLNIKGTWDSQLYPAGSAAIFLANGRKQALGLLAVVQF